MTDAEQRPVPPPPTGCRTDDDHDWARTDTVTIWSAKERLLWDRCLRCGRQRFVVAMSEEAEEA